MAQIYEDNAMTIGQTPLVRLKKMFPHGNVLAKVESRNPGFSVKCRIGAALIWDAEKNGILNTQKEIIEPTSGNTGISLAFVAASRGYPITLTMPSTMSLERRKLLKALGANLVLTEGERGMQGAIDAAWDIYHKNPGRYVHLQQFSNPANPQIHQQTTGPEIWQDTDGQVDVLIAGVGTGGTISGTSRFLKSKKHILSVAVEPEESPVITQTLAGSPVITAPHKIQGIGPGFIPDNLDLSLVDRALCISSNEAIETAHQLMHQEGILAGISSGAAVAAAQKLVSEGMTSQTMVVILPSSAERYLSSPLFRDVFTDKELSI